MPRTSPSRIALVAIALSALLLTGCQAAEGTPPTATTGIDSVAEKASAACAEAAAKPLDTTVSVKDLTGVSTACLPNPDVEILDNPGSPQLPATTTDAAGTSVTVTDASRILALDITGTLAATVWALGLGDQLVGRDTSTHFPGTDKLPVATGTSHTLNVEAILNMEPSVIFTDGSLGPKAAVAQLAEAGIPIVKVTQDRTMFNTGDIVATVANSLGMTEAGDRLSARIQTEIDAAKAQIAEVVPAEGDRPNVLFLYARGSAGIYYLFGEGSGADALITAIGGRDLAKTIGWSGMKPMTAEALLAAQPDVLLMMTDGLESVGGVDGLLTSIPALAETPAGLHRRIVQMNGSEILAFGPRTGATITALNRALYSPADAE